MWTPSTGLWKTSEGTNNMTRLAFFIPTLHGGGAETIVLRLAASYAKRGIATDLVVGTLEGELTSAVESKVNVIDLGASRVRGCIIPLSRYLRRVRPTTLLATMNHANIAAVLASMLAHIETRIVLRVPITQDGPTRKRFHLMDSALRMALHRANGVIAISRGVAQRINERTGFPLERIAVIHNPAFTDEFLNVLESPQEFRLIPDHAPVILAAGRLTPQKDFPTLIRSFAKLRREKDAYLIILGEGPERGGLLELIYDLGIEDCVFLPGYVENIMAYMQRANLFVLSSAWEGFGNVVVEALAAGTPVVSTNCPSGPAEILEDGKYGSLVSVGDDVQMMAAMRHALETSSNPHDLVNRAKDFHLDVIIKQYDGMLFPGYKLPNLSSPLAVMKQSKGDMEG